MPPKTAPTKLQAVGAIDVKLERGGIRDIEFVVQCLQRLYGGAEPWVRHGGTLLALARLQDKGFLSGAEYGRLASAYQFLRHLEHRLQFADDRQTHTLAVRPRARSNCWRRRMPGGGGSADWLLDRDPPSLRASDRDLRTRGPLPHRARWTCSRAARPRQSNVVRVARSARARTFRALLAEADLPPRLSCL